MDSRKILNNDQIGLSPYNKMEEENSSQNQLGNGFTNLETKKCLWPHQWTLHECCCGCSLRTGSLFIGWGLMISSSFLLVGSFVSPVPALFQWEDLIFTCLKFISSIVLLVGIYKHTPRIIRASCILSMIDTVAEVILAVVFSVQMMHPLPVFILIFILPLSIYFLVVVNSLSIKMSAGLIVNPNEVPTVPGMNV